MAFKVYVTSNEIPQSALDVMNSIASVQTNDGDGILGRTTLLEKVKEVDALLCLLTVRVDWPC